MNITGNHISYNRLGGIRLERSEVRNLQITGNDIEYNNHAEHGTEPEPTAEIYVDVAGKNSVNEVTVASNTIQATPSEGGPTSSFGMTNRRASAPDSGPLPATSLATR